MIGGNFCMWHTLGKIASAHEGKKPRTGGQEENDKQKFKTLMKVRVSKYE
jgi:hypothetical protein